MVKVIGLVTWPGVMSKVMVLFGQASRMTCRNEPGPLSALVVTTRVEGQTTKLAVLVVVLDSFVPLLSASKLIVP